MASVTAVLSRLTVSTPHAPADAKHPGVEQEAQETQQAVKIEPQEQTDESSLNNISLDSANYLQNAENISQSEETPNFEVESIELATPQLFSDDEGINATEQVNNNSEPEIFENKESVENTEANIKEPEMFENQDTEEDFEIPAFLRRQKN